VIVLRNPECCVGKESEVVCGAVVKRGVVALGGFHGARQGLAVTCHAC
jgi:hypothetical protein